ncbi:hypothetical protein [Kribbella antiqua]|uniref:hypothetical protein n=1 Tax=Kribbella antiqua TaxID=2512217 RepID=UPI001050FFAD|nr:hypothetical protein [Kribbella antiqua]
MLDYLDRLGVDVSTQLKLVVGTHAHDDHIAGLSQVYTRASSAQFVMSAAATSEEFFAQVEADESIEREIRPKIRSEYRAILDEAKRRGAIRNNPRPILKAYEQRPLWQRSARDDLPGVAITALSPSDEAIDRAQLKLAEGTAKVESRRRLSAADPNEMAVAIWVEVGDHAILLGSDLLNGPSRCGWSAVLSSITTDARASVFKVAHHGSPNAHHPSVWSDLLDPDVVALLAPYRGGRTPRPAPSDISRILTLTDNAYISATPTKPESAATRRVAAHLKGLATSVRDPWATVGQVRARMQFEASVWDVETVRPARHLSQVSR